MDERQLEKGLRAPDREEIELLHGRLCHALADATRIAILYELAAGPRHVTALVDALGQPQATVSRHLRVLHERSLVLTERIGTRVEYRLADPRIIHALDLMRALLADALDRESELAARIRDARKRPGARKKTSTP
ncbi:MAG: helix-turn-helix transcriptional regulator [Candidatus Eisenbacteria bacterium]|uniref:Helix-turn-helix transcriptional regulator n=1 Tax=Eiseniibacteriota bacterium TaxID=2212470 RepID=A0A956SC85_UNCEI|nr:helix-turn-helix transcriptional regulator [Candidatus Eisenbacteria bacterium]